jgi:hypothetical protein
VSVGQEILDGAKKRISLKVIEANKNSAGVVNKFRANS